MVREIKLRYYIYINLISQLQEVISILEQRNSNMQMDDEDGINNSKLDSLIVIDRTIDMITPFAMPFT